MLVEEAFRAAEVRLALVIDGYPVAVDVAQQVGTALHALRARDSEALVRALANGVDLNTARKRARAVQASGIRSA